MSEQPSDQPTLPSQPTQPQPQVPAPLPSPLAPQNRPSRKSLYIIIGSVIGAVLIVCCCVSLIAFAALGGNSSPTGSSQGHPTATAQVRKSHPTATPTILATRGTAQPTATHPTSTSGATVLGAPGSNFLGKFTLVSSQSDTSRGDLHFNQYPGVAYDYLIVQTAEYFGDTPAGDVFSILVQSPPDQPWDATTAHATCGAFFPTDAQKVKAYTVTNASGVAGEDVVYQSTILAQTFPANEFQDVNQNQASPGSFDVYYLYLSNDSSQIDSCSIFIGTQQTQG